MPRSSSYSRYKNSRSYSRDRDRDYKRRSSSDDDHYDRKRSHRRSRSPSSSSRSKLSYRSSRRRSNSSSDNDYCHKKKSRNHKDKKLKKSKHSHRSPSTTSSSSIESTKSRSKSRQPSKRISPIIYPAEKENEQKKIYNLNLLERKVTSETLEDIENDKFESKIFTSSNSSKQASQKVYINLKKDTIIVPTSNDPEPVNDSLFHPNFLGDEVEEAEKWVKKLFNFRQRLLYNT